MQILPAIIPIDYEDLEEHLSEVKDLVPLVQIDICDGKFVKSTSWPYSARRSSSKARSDRVSHKALAVAQGGLGRYSDDFEKILKEEEGFPYWREIDFEADLMVMNPFEVVPDWILAGASAVVIHVESVLPKVLAVELSKLRMQFPKNESGVVSFQVGLALNPDTPNDVILPYLEDVDFIQFMGSSRIGFQGEGLDERVLGKIRELRNNHPQVTISIDIGVTLDNAKLLKEEGVDKLISGSAIFESDNIIEIIDAFKRV